MYTMSMVTSVVLLTRKKQKDNGHILVTSAILSKCYYQDMKFLCELGSQQHLHKNIEFVRVIIAPEPPLMLESFLPLTCPWRYLYLSYVSSLSYGVVPKSHVEGRYSKCK